MRRAIPLAFVGAMLSACLLTGGECPCGASTSDPIGAHDTSFTGDHVVDGQCLCTCGDDFPESFDDNGDCREHQTDCTDSDGNAHTFVCR